MLNVNYSNNVNFEGSHYGLRKTLSKESRELLNAAIKEMNTAEKTLEKVRCGKAALANRYSGILDCLNFKVTASNGDIIEISKTSTSPTNSYGYSINHIEASEIEKSHLERKRDTLFFDSPRKEKGINFTDYKPEESHWDPKYWEKIENNKDLLQKVEDFIQKYAPLFITKK